MKNEIIGGFIKMILIWNKTKKQDQKKNSTIRKQGFSLVSILVSMAILGIFASTITATIVFQSKGLLSVSRKLEVLAIDNSVANVLGSLDTCTCQLSTSLNPLLFIDTTSTPIPDIDLGTLRSGCALANNIIVESGQPLKTATNSDIMVDSVKVTNIVPTGSLDAYEGDLVVEYTVMGRSIRPTSVSLLMFTGPPPPAALPILKCLGAGARMGAPCLITDESPSMNTLMGCGGTINSGGMENAFLGTEIAPNNTGNQNTFVGTRAGNSNTTGYSNVYVGEEAGRSATTAFFNTFVGFQAGQSHVDGANNVMVGTLVGQNANTDLEDSVFVGYAAGRNSTGNQNVFVGFEAGFNNDGDSNIFIGYKAGYDNQGGDSDNIFVGAHAGELSRGKKNVFIGSESGKKNDNKNENVFVGAYTGVKNKGNDNVFLGHSAGRLNKIGHDNVFVGQGAGGSNTIGYRNTFVGEAAGWAQTSGRDNVFVGEKAGALSTTFGSELVFVGHSAGERNTTGTENTFIGNLAGFVNTTGSRNTLIGSRAGQFIEVEDDNVLMVAGTSLGRDTFRSVAVGNNAGNLSEGEYNTFIGNYSGAGMEGGKNTTFGQGAGGGISNDSSENTFVGFTAGGYRCGNDIHYNTAIGHVVGVPDTVGENLGDGNTFIGRYIQLGQSPGGNVIIASNLSVTTSYTNNFIVAEKYNSTDLWLLGNIKSSGNLYVDGQAVQVQSSRMLKKDIVGFEDYEQSLQDILNTPLYHYKYKNKLDYPHKLRMGIISEELPDHLQLKKKNFLSHPDWPSIYGAFWASLKALYERFIGFQEKLEEYVLQVQSGSQSFSNLISQAKRHLENLKEEISIFKENLFSPSGVLEFLTSLKNHQAQLFKEIKQEQEQIIKLQDQLQKAQEKLDLLKQNKTGNAKKALRGIKENRLQDELKEQKRKAVL